MTRWNRDFNSHFKGRRLILSTPDLNRGRTVQVFDIGELDIVGMSDGVDAWISLSIQSINGHDLVKALSRADESPEHNKVTRRVFTTQAPSPTANGGVKRRLLL